MSDHLKIGVGRRDITPELGTYLAGYPDPERFAQSIRDRLASSTLVFEQGPTRAAIISLDLAIVDDLAIAEIRRGCKSATGIPEENIVVAATQTHSGPMAFDCFGWGTKNQAYVDWAVPLIVESCLEAANGIRPATVGIGVTQSDVGVNRRNVTEDGRVELSYNPWGLYDPEMIVLRFEGENGPIATLINYGAHPTVLGMGTRAISRDWPGIMVDRVEELTDAPAVYVNGAVGDIAPRSNFQYCVGDGESALQEVGTRASMDSMRAFRSIREFTDLDLAVYVEDLVLPYRPLPTLDAAQARVAELEPTKDQWGMPKCEYMHWQSVVNERRGIVQTTKRIPHQIVTLGPVAFVPFPGEPFAETILRLKQYTPFQHTVCMSTTNGFNGYFPTREAQARGGYEIEIAKASGPYILASNIDDVLVSENLRMLRAASPPRPSATAP